MKKLLFTLIFLISFSLSGQTVRQNIYQNLYNSIPQVNYCQSRVVTPMYRNQSQVPNYYRLPIVVTYQPLVFYTYTPSKILIRQPVYNIVINNVARKSK